MTPPRWGKPRYRDLSCAQILRALHGWLAHIPFWEGLRTLPLSVRRGSPDPAGVPDRRSPAPIIACGVKGIWARQPLTKEGDLRSVARRGQETRSNHVRGPRVRNPSVRRSRPKTSVI